MTETESIINDCDLVDRISALPDSILGLILSFLFTKHAVATSVLSKRWKFAWVTIHNLDFQNLCLRYDGTRDMKFVGFVDRVLLLQDAGLLNKFSLVWWSGCIPSHVTSWVNTAIAKNVRELSLNLWIDDGQFKMPTSVFNGQFEMPTSVFNCNSLRSLHLGGVIYVSAAIPLFLPRLETLKLRGVHFLSQEAFENFISGSPMLYYLDLRVDNNNDFIMCRISSTSLRHVEIFFRERCPLELNTCSLEYLKVNGQISEVFVQNNLSSLVKVDFKIIYEERFCNSIVEAVRAFHRAKFLIFSKDVMLALSNATIGLSTEFKRLVALKIETCSSVLHSKKYRGNLGALTINQDEKCSTLEEVARCLSNSLRFVSVDCDRDYGEVDRETIRYILKHGRALEHMTINGLVRYGIYEEDGRIVEDSATTKFLKVGDGRNVEDSAKSKFVNVEDGRIVVDSATSKLVKEIREFPRNSPVCVVAFG